MKSNTLLMVGSFVLGMFIYSLFEANKNNRVIESYIVLEQIRNVSKLVTTEGTYSNIYRIGDYYWVKLFPFQKELIVKVKLKALVGVDLSKVKVTTDEKNKVLYLDSIPDVEAISLDPEVHYFNMDNGFFNSFNEEDLNQLNMVIRQLSLNAIEHSDYKPKNRVEELVAESFSAELNGFFIPLVSSAKIQVGKQLSMIKELGKTMGWDVRYSY
jgi:hypothetical protein